MGMNFFDQLVLPNMKLNRSISLAIIRSAFIASLSACEKERSTEKAGKAVDNVIGKTGQQVEKAGDNIQDAAKRDKK